MAKRLTSKQQRFVDAFTGPALGNATEAARMAGYRGGERACSARGAECLANELVKAAIEERTAAVRSEAVMSSYERQVWLTKVMRGETDGDSKPGWRERLSACDQLNKMQGSYTEKREITHSGGGVLRITIPQEFRADVSEETRREVEDQAIEEAKAAWTAEHGAPRAVFIMPENGRSTAEPN